MSRCIVVCAGEQGAVGFSPRPDDFVIACDAGYDRALAMGLKADLLVGDFDSRPHADLPRDLAVLRFPVDKDDTDSLLAIKEGLARGYRDFVLLCALGGRLSHTLANIQALAFAAWRGCRAEALGPRERLLMIQNERLELPAEGWEEISVFAYGGPISRVTLSGLYYPLDGPLTADFPLGVSNRFTGVPASVEVSGGTALVLLYRPEAAAQTETSRN
jgi:thiamine pyrophosphokinase